MKATLAVVLALAVTAIAPAAQAQQLEPGRPVSQMLQQMKKVPERPAGPIEPNVIFWNIADYIFIIPAAGNVPGANNTHFKSDVTLANFGPTAQRVEVAWLPRGSANCDTLTTILTLEPGWRYFEDFVGTTLGKSGLGTLLFMGIDDTDDIDFTATLDAFSRIWTPVQSGNGTTSQQFSAISFFDLFGDLSAYAIGLRHDAGFRTNAGLVNLDEVQRSWTLEIHPATGTRPSDVVMTVPPCSMTQTNIPAGDYGAVLLKWNPHEGTEENWWSAYGSSTDNFTGDGWIVQANHGTN